MKNRRKYSKYSTVLTARSVFIFTTLLGCSCENGNGQIKDADTDQEAMPEAVEGGSKLNIAF
jgi:hypothetical protein